MKPIRSLFLGAAVLGAILLAGCSKSDSVATKASTAPARAREIELTANDAMKFSVTEIRAKAGESLEVTLINIGSVPKAAMGHNWVLLAEGTDVSAFATAAAGAANTNYIPDSFKDRVLAATKLLGPRESDTVHFTAPSKPGRYPFVCAFPGHLLAGMKGELIVE